MHLLDRSAYGLRHGRKVLLSKLGRSHGQPTPFHMAKTLCITHTVLGKSKGISVRLADGPIVAMIDKDNITYLMQRGSGCK